MNERAVTRAIERWFAGHARDLPWRETDSAGMRDPYRALVSEFMLQQTQVSRVLEKFGAFIERFPDLHALASAPEDDVLAVWSGLGYYSRAKRLHAAARAVVEHHGGIVPSDVDALLTLPGVGRYTAGAIASMVFGERAALVDGNVQRVFVRLYGEELALGARDTERWAWERAESFVRTAGEPGVFNEGLMELGATVCTPRSPSCLVCPVRERCAACAQGRQEELPLPKARAKRREVWHGVAVCVDDGRVLLRKRDDSGLWAGMWAPPSVERTDHEPDGLEIGAIVGGETGGEVHRFTHETTHRAVRFRVFEVKGGRPGEGDRWCSLPDLKGLGVSNAHLRIVKRALGSAES
ncbi:MAG: A/G-specific adenine glycosylase [Planctomycetota bacterium]